MEFIKLGKDKYLIKNSNSIIVTEKEKLELEKKQLVIKDVTSNDCQAETTQEITKIDKELNDIDAESLPLSTDGKLKKNKRK